MSFQSTNSNQFQSTSSRSVCQTRTQLKHPQFQDCESNNRKLERPDLVMIFRSVFLRVARQIEEYSLILASNNSYFQVIDNDRGVNMRPMPGMIGMIASSSKIQELYKLLCYPSAVKKKALDI
ncbi:hypothetical protein CQW23_16795 [Capsicum baccatum]|uniref:Uncharacterized protein n=1 Tax=Capsicum baccatum TaxID=33114 RepID=A0A2G2WCD5_CAPBA|nr:hypothetical protein CQW23_16795 [Capsicum baccatum]